MIKINLASKKKSSVGLGKSGKPSLGIDQLGGMVDELKGLPIRKMAIPIVVAIVANVLVSGYMDNEVKEVDAELTKVRAEKPRLDAEAAKLKSYEDLKKALEADEATLKKKLQAIQTLLNGRTDTARILEDLSRAIPHTVWLTDFQMKDVDVSIKGLSLDFDPVLDFQKTLNENVYFSGVEAKNTVQDPQKRLVSFELQGQRKKVAP